MIAVAISFFCWLPNYQVFADFIQTPYGSAKIWWLNHPFKAVPVEQFFPRSEWHHGYNAGIASHLDKLTFRALLPLLNQIAPFGIWTVVAASHLAGVAILWLTYQLVAKQTQDPVSAALTTWALAACYAGQYGFEDHYLGDAVAVSMLVAAMATRQRLLITLAMLGAYLTDERTIFATPLVVLFHAMAPPLHHNTLKPDVVPHTLQDKVTIPWGTLRKTIAPFATALAAYIALRLLITLTTGAQSGTTMVLTREIIATNLYESFPERVFKVFEFLWFIVIAFLVETTAQLTSRRSFRRVLALCLIVAAIPAYMVIDLERSLLYLTPAVIMSACFLPASQSLRRRFLVFITAANFAWIYPTLSAFRLATDLIPG